VFQLGTQTDVLSIFSDRHVVTMLCEG